MAGTLRVNGTHADGGAYTVASGGTLGGTGHVNTSGDAGVTVLAGGKLAPGASAGVLHMNLGTGVLDISDAVLAANSQSMQFELAAIGASDQVQLTNVATGLNIGSGVLEFNDFVFTNLGGLTSGPYTLFDTGLPIIGTLGSSLSGSIGAFSATLGLGDGGNDIVLTVSGGSPPGDFNGDGSVNAADYVVWRRNPGNFPLNAYDIWRANFGNPPGSGSGLGTDAAVPEPAVGGTLLLAFVMASAIRANRKGRRAV
jgi:hypothetical protein